MTASLRIPAPGALAADGPPGPIAPHEREPLLAWLAAGLRPEHPEWLEAEHPVALAPARIADHVVVRRGGRIAAHALAHGLDARVAGRPARLGLIGLVYTDPAHRGRGLARACVAAATARLAAQGALVVALWSDLDDFYAPLGFRRGGREWILSLDPRALARARDARDASLAVGPPTDLDWPQLEALQHTRPTRAERAPGALARLAAAPGCHTRVARRAGQVVAYACAGRGADLRDHVHEWAGETQGVLACVEALAAVGARHWLGGPGGDPAVERLRSAGADALAGDFALLHVPDPPALLAHVVASDASLARVRLRRGAAGFVLAGSRGAAALGADETTRLLLAPTRPALPGRVLDDAEGLALERRLPWPVGLSGFDSV
jgi:GNAT superfamily N-acetyltransferase